MACTCIEQPDVLDGDHGLVGEGLHQFDLPVGERSHFGTTDDNCTNGILPLASRGLRKAVRMPRLLRESVSHGKLCLFGQQVMHVNRAFDPPRSAADPGS